MSTASIRVLLVEDNDDHACLIVSAFEDHGTQWHVTTVQSLEAARAELEKSPPDLVIVDNLLPDGQGTQLLPRHRERTRCPFILMTSHGNESIAVDAIKGGALEYVVKSEFALAAMPRTAERVLREWQMIVEQAQARDRERQLISELAHSDRKNTIGEMAAALVHEVNQPLTVIAAYSSMCAELLQRNQLRMDELREAMSQIDQQARRAGEIVNGLKRFIAKGAPNRSNVDLNSIISDVAVFMKNIAMSRRSTIELKLDDARPQVRADAVQIQQVLVNLIQNALDAMEDVEPQLRRIILKTVAIKDTVRVSVCDRGPGLSADSMEQLFEPYFTTKQSGLGLGLSISQRIVEAHGGRLLVSPNPEGGLTFEFTIPAAYAATMALQ